MNRGGRRKEGRKRARGDDEVVVGGEAARVGDPPLPVVRRNAESAACLGARLLDPLPHERDRADDERPARAEQRHAVGRDARRAGALAAEAELRGHEGRGRARAAALLLPCLRVGGLLRAAAAAAARGARRGRGEAEREHLDRLAEAHLLAKEAAPGHRGDLARGALERGRVPKGRRARGGAERAEPEARAEAARAALGVEHEAERLELVGAQADGEARRLACGRARARLERGHERGERAAARGVAVGEAAVSGLGAGDARVHRARGRVGPERDAEDRAQLRRARVALARRAPPGRADLDAARVVKAEEGAEAAAHRVRRRPDKDAHGEGASAARGVGRVGLELEAIARERVLAAPARRRRADEEARLELPRGGRELGERARGERGGGGDARRVRRRRRERRALGGGRRARGTRMDRRRREREARRGERLGGGRDARRVDRRRLEAEAQVEAAGGGEARALHRHVRGHGQRLAVRVHGRKVGGAAARVRRVEAAAEEARGGGQRVDVRALR
jgi:hypothetical protein